MLIFFKKYIKFLLICIFVTQIFNWNYSIGLNILINIILGVCVSPLVYGVYYSFKKKIPVSSINNTQRINIGFCFLIAFFFFILDAVGRGILRGLLNINLDIILLTMLVFYVGLGIIIGSEALKRGVSITLSILIALSLLFMFRLTSYFLIKETFSFFIKYAHGSMIANTILEGIFSLVGAFIIWSFRKRSVVY